MSKRAVRKSEHKKKACAEIGLKAKYDEQGTLQTTWGEINKANAALIAQKNRKQK